jgi:hypothetical protein
LFVAGKPHLEFATEASPLPLSPYLSPLLLSISFSVGVSIANDPIVECFAAWVLGSGPRMTAFGVAL